MDNLGSITIELTPDKLKKVIDQQLGYFESTEHRKANCVMLGIIIIQILDQVATFSRDIKTNELKYQGRKVYIDGDLEYAISVGYNPFLDKQKLIL